MSYLDRFKKWLTDHHIDYHDASYERRHALGTVQAFFMSPSQANGHTIIFVHGTGNDLFYQQLYLFKELMQNGFNIFTFDLDGHGRHSSTIFSEQSILTALPAAYEQLLKIKPGVKNIHLIGQSLGAALIAANLKQLTTINSAVLISLPINLAINFKTFFFEAASLFYPTTIAQLQHFGPFELLPALGPFKRRCFPTRTHDQKIKSFYQQIKNTVEQINNTEPLKQSSIPICLLFGSRDYLTPLGSAKNVTPNNDKFVWAEIPSQTHFTTIFSKRTIDVIIDWLNQHRNY